MLFYTAHSDDPEFCFYPEDVTHLSLGSFAAGTYTVEVDRWSDFFNPPVQLVGDLSMTVVAAPVPIQAPTLGTFAELGIVAMLALLGCASLGRCQRGVPLILFSCLKAPLMALLLAVVTPSAFAYVGPPTLTPANPIAGQPVTLNVPWGICDLIGTSNSFPNNGIPQITIDRHSITTLFYTLHADDPEFCFYPEDVAHLSLGSFAAGTYDVEVDRWSDFFNPPVQLVGDLSMTVVAAPVPIQAPTLGTFAELGIVAMLALFGCASLSRSRRGVPLVLFSCFKAPLAAFLLALVSPSAFAYLGPPTLSPGSPVAGQPVTLNVPYGGGCQGIGESVSDPNQGVPQITVDGNAISVLFYGVSVTDPVWCIYPDGVAQLDLGSYQPGTYAVHVTMWHDDSSQPEVLVIGDVSMTVQGAPAPIQAPTLGTFAELGIVAMLALFGCASLSRSRRGVPLIMIALLAGLGAKNVRAQTSPRPQSIEVMVSAAPGAPTPAAIVDYFAQHPLAATAPLQSLTVESPTAAAYLMPVRAAGDYLTFLNANPTSPGAMLERYVVVKYPASANLQTALTALRADPYVQAAYVPASAAFSSAGLLSFTVGGDDPLDGGSQYGRSDLNIDVTWQLAGGYSLIGDLDTGLYEQHPALAQFTPTGTYLGGNFIPALPTASPW